MDVSDSTFFRTDFDCCFCALPGTVVRLNRHFYLWQQVYILQFSILIFFFFFFFSIVENQAIRMPKQAIIACYSM